MEGEYYNNPSFPYAEDLKRDNEENEKGKNVNDFISKNVIIYASFNNSMKWRDKIFEGKILEIDNNHLVLLDFENNNLFIPKRYINFIQIKNR